MTIVGIPVVAVGVVEAIELDQSGPAFVYVVLFIPIVVVTIFQGKLPFKLKAGVLLVCVFLLASHNLTVYGFSGAGIPLFLTLFILVTIFFGLTYGLVSISASLIPIVLAGYHMVKGNLSPAVDLEEIVTMPISWVTATAVLVLMGLLVVVSYSFIQRNLFHIIQITKKQADALRKSNQRLVREIRQKEEVERNLKKAKEDAEESDRLKSAFLANMSHEIRTPMNGIMGFTHLLRDHELSSEKRAEYVQIIQQSGRRMLDFVNSLLDIAMIEAGQAEIQVVETHVNEIMDDLLALFRPEARKKGLSLEVEKGSAGDQAQITTDATKLNQVLANLLKNAIKYTTEGHVVFGYTRKEGVLEFFVSDTGIGISYELQHKIFERFRQADLDYSRAYEGAGLGLSISKAYVEMLGGQMWVDSSPGRGSVFYFTLPLDAPSLS